MHVVLVELHDVFDEVLHRDGLHVVCKRKQRNTEFVCKMAGRQAGRQESLRTFKIKSPHRRVR